MLVNLQKHRYSPPIRLGSTENLVIDNGEGFSSVSHVFSYMYGVKVSYWGVLLGSLLLWIVDWINLMIWRLLCVIFEPR